MTTPLNVLSISPAPTSQEAAAIAAAIEMLWPKPVLISSPPSTGTAWRFSGRHWVTDQRHTRNRPRR